MWTWNGETGQKGTVMNLARQMLGLLLCTLLVSGGSAAALEKVVYFHNDALGSPVAATNAQGQVLWTEAYDPYGTRVVKPASAKANHLWYTGKQEETELGLNYFGARWYEPGIGRFHGIDPVGFQDGNVQSFNRFAYANNNPYRYVDPDGQWAEDVVLGVPSLAIGAHSLYSNAKAGNWGSAAVDAGGVVADGIAILVPGVPGGAGLGIKATREAGKGVAKVAPDFDAARRTAFDNAGMTDASKIQFSKVDPKTGTVVEFKGESGAKVGYDGPHESPGPHHDTQHISWQSGGKRGSGAAQRGNEPYSGAQHPSRPDRKNQ